MSTDTMTMPTCPKCGEADTYAEAPDWMPTGIAAEMTFPRCEHAWTAQWALIEMPPNGEVSGADRRPLDCQVMP